MIITKQKINYKLYAFQKINFKTIVEGLLRSPYYLYSQLYMYLDTIDS